MVSLRDTVEFKDIDICNTKYVDEQTVFVHRRTLIIVTIDDPQIQQVDIQKLMEMGVNVIRLKTSNFSRTDKIDIIKNIDGASKVLARKYGVRAWPCATCIDLKTSIVQTGLLEEEARQIFIDTNSEVVLTTEISQFDKCNQHSIFVDNPCLTLDVMIGMEIYIDQDELTLVCTAKDEKTVTCKVTKGGYLRNMSYVCIRGAKRSQPRLTKIDYQLIKFAVQYQVDMILINYAHTVETILKIKKFLANTPKRPLIIVGISTMEGIMNIDEFVQHCEGVLLAREFLPFEMDKDMYFRMGRVQSYIAGKCRENGIPFYISGDVFQEGLRTGRLCHWEISDVTNALMRWTAGFVLSGYDNIHNLCFVIKQMNDLCTNVEPMCSNKTEFWQQVSRMKMPMNAAEACALSCAAIANQTNARLIIIPTVSGRTAMVMNSLPPNAVVVGVTSKVKTARLLESIRSVVPILYKGPPRRLWFNTVHARVHSALTHAVAHKWIDNGDLYMSLEKATEESSFCDTLRVWNATDDDTNKNVLNCFESYHDFDFNTYAEPLEGKKKEKLNSIVNETVEKCSKENENAKEIAEDNGGDENEQKQSEETHDKVEEKEEKEEKIHYRI